ncbi:unnamed protein product [Meloidogyne enterolobii]|uniref:Uncharacterized protein n=1 Tax=Meloidogyne enterolobii TaxID=390850 RepID=A0ACB0YZN4_MELEN
MSRVGKKVRGLWSLGFGSFRVIKREKVGFQVSDRIFKIFFDQGLEIEMDLAWDRGLGFPVPRVRSRHFLTFLGCSWTRSFPGLQAQDPAQVNKSNYRVQEQVQALQILISTGFESKKSRGALKCFEGFRYPVISLIYTLNRVLDKSRKNSGRNVSSEPTRRLVILKGFERIKD